ncbi:hypothetical protein Syun_018638 [Stephania yunnanensis]|uniref:U6 snRNA phosphodiesterase n=1 Tax=Stephania yunnanensis TaxID=152371 RepID=A0AAP0IUZ1_9MAGN
MEALLAAYGDSASSSDSDSSPSTAPSSISLPKTSIDEEEESITLPPPPLNLLNPPNSLDYHVQGQGSRVRSFPHVEGNYALHVYIPVCIPPSSKNEVAQFIKRVANLVPGLHVVDIDMPLDVLCKEEQKLEHALGRTFHVSLGRTVPIRLHQIDSIVSMFRKKLLSKRRYLMDFRKWVVFVNDEGTRTFLSMEITSSGLAEIRKQISVVNEIYRLHSLPEFYKDPRPHISLAWAVGDVSHLLGQAIQDVSCSNGTFSSKNIFSSTFNGIECKIGNKTYEICKSSRTS